MKINVIQGKFVNENSFLSIANLFNNLFSKTSLNFKFYSSDDYMLNNLEDDDQKEEILKKIKFDEKVINNGEGPTFEYFFKEITNQRDYAYHINKDEFVIYLTGEKNERNFFGWIDEEMKNCFINTSIWKRIYDSNVDCIYPISYEIIAWVLRVLMFENPTELYQNAHFNDISCLMNFCEDAKKHEIKTKTGEICKECIDRIRKKGISQEKLIEIYASLDKIRNFILNRENHIIYPSIKIVKNNGENYHFILPEYGDLIIPFEQRLISIYWFFLRNNEEIYTKSLKNYREEILSLHKKVNKIYSLEKITESIDKIVGLSNDPVYKGKNEFSSVKSKINSEIKEIIPNKISKDYIISGVRMEPNKILLNRKYFIDLK
jgi:hypothetical protein